MARRGSETRTRDATITARVEPSVKTAVAKAAVGGTESDWLRSVIIERLDLKVEAIEPPKKRARKKLSDAKNAELGELARAVAQSTGMLKLSAQTFREQAEVKLHAEAETALAQMNKAAERIFQLLDVQRK